MHSRDTQITALLIGIILALTLPAFWGRPAPDLAPLWVAAHFVADGNWAMVYPDPGPVFTVTTPPIWGEMADVAGHSGLILAYIYPPLWAGLIAPLTKLVSISAFQNTVLLINHLALFGIIFLARRIAAPKVPASLYLGLATIILASGPFVPLALFQNQPQILVSFLTLLAIERQRAAPLVAGAVLGLAVSLKIAPIFLLPILLAHGNWRQIAIGFVAIGGGLGVCSILIAGWPVHAQYLSILSTIAGTVVLSDAAYTVDALLSQFWLLNDMIFIGTGGPGNSDEGWWIGGKSGLWSLLSLAATLSMVAGFTAFTRRGAGPLVWPAALILLGLFGSIAWSFYFIAPLAFLPALMGRLGNVRGGVLAVLLALPGSYLILPLARDSAVLPFADQAMGVLTLALTACVFTFLSFRRDQPLHPGPPRV